MGQLLNSTDIVMADSDKTIVKTLKKDPGFSDIFVESSFSLFNKSAKIAKT